MFQDPNQLYPQAMGMPPPQPMMLQPMVVPPPSFDPNNPTGMPYMAAGMVASNLPMAIPPPEPAKNRGKSSTLPATLTKQELANLSPEQVTAMQVEQAIKESQNPGLRLRKLRSPLSVRSCLLNLLLFVVLTLVIVFLVIAFWPGVGVDRFNFLVVLRDMWHQFGLAAFFSMIGNWFTNLFSGCGAATYDPYQMFNLIR